MPDNDLEKELKIALSEVGAIEPWWSEDDQMYLFHHPAYPMVDYLHSDPTMVKERYLLILKEFIEARLAGQVANVTERLTDGRGGVRPGAGRKPKAYPRKRVQLPEDIADFVAEADNQPALRKWMKSYLRKKSSSV